MFTGVKETLVEMWHQGVQRPSPCVETRRNLSFCFSSRGCLGGRGGPSWLQNSFRARATLSSFFTEKGELLSLRPGGRAALGVRQGQRLCPAPEVSSVRPRAAAEPMGAGAQAGGSVSLELVPGAHGSRGAGGWFSLPCRVLPTPSGPSLSTGTA